ncbi:MAG: aspH [Myxococcales bacterium]|nr:aspH [Myxococcales bacterium]
METELSAAKAPPASVCLDDVSKPSRPKPAKTFRERAYDVAMAILRPITKLIERTSLIPTTPFLGGVTFPWVARAEAAWPDVRRELDQVLTWRDDLPAFHEINGDATDLRNDDWKTFLFCGFGLWSAANCRRCPKTAALLESIPGAKTAFFSILLPGARLPPHKGAWKGVIRYHLALMVPQPEEQCGIQVDGQIAHWREGGSLLFDDTYEHAAWNDTKGTRVVLFVDVVRPCRFPGSLVNRAVIAIAALTPFIRSSLRRQRAWERRFGAKHGDLAAAGPAAPMAARSVGDAGAPSVEPR